MVTKELVVINENDIKWLDEAREYVLKRKNFNKSWKLFYIGLLQFSNLSAWRDYIDGGYSPSEAIEEDLTYAD